MCMLPYVRRGAQLLNLVEDDMCHRMVSQPQKKESRHTKREKRDKRELDRNKHRGRAKQPDV